MRIRQKLGRWGALLALVVSIAIPPAVNGQSAFFRDVVLKPLATQADGIRMVSLLLGQREGNLETDTDFLKGRSIMPSNWKPADKALLSKGYAAYLLVKALRIQGGAGARVMGWDKRRAFQELVYLQIMPGKGGEHAKLTGPEVITLLDRATAHRARNGTASSKAAAAPGGQTGGTK